jgi:PAS domain S-box-containing protein
MAAIVSLIADVSGWCRARWINWPTSYFGWSLFGGIAVALGIGIGLAFDAISTTTACVLLVILTSSLLLHSTASRKNTELALRIAEQRYRHLFDHCPAALLEGDALVMRDLFKSLHDQGVTDFSAFLGKNPDFLSRAMEAPVIVNANRRAVEMFGARNAVELLGSTGRIWGQNPDVFQRALESRLRGELTFQDEIKVQALDGHLIDAVVTLSRQDSANNLGPHYIALADLTKQVRANEEIRLSEQRHRALFEQARRTQEMVAENEQRYRQLFEYAPVALAQLDAGNRTNLLKQVKDQGVTDLKAYFDQHPDVLWRIKNASTVVNVNRRMVEMFGARDASELLGKTHRFWQRSPETHLHGLESRLRGESKFQAEMEVDTLDGRVINVVITLARPKELDRLGINFIGFVDVTDQVRATRMLQKLQGEFAHAARISMLGELTASIAHEINQPLTAIMANGEASLYWLNRSEPDILKARESIGRIIEATNRSDEIISRLRSMAAGRAPRFADVSLNRLIDEAIEFLSHQIKSKNVEVSLELDGTLPVLSGDPIQLQQVVVNLIVNAIQAMDQPNIRRRALVIRTASCKGDVVCCSFEDGGPGIDPSDLVRLFNSFFTTKDTGMGMGLPVSRAIVETHGGHMRADNQSVLGGARFVVMLPVRPTVSGDQLAH